MTLSEINEKDEEASPTLVDKELLIGGLEIDDEKSPLDPTVTFMNVAEDLEDTTGERSRITKS